MMKETQPGPHNSRTINISIQLEKEQPAQIQGTKDKGQRTDIVSLCNIIFPTNVGICYCC